MHGSAMLAASGSATGFALSTSLQHLAAGRVPAETRGTHRLLAHLVSRPLWLLGQLLALVAFTLHAVALHLGSLIVVQPVVVSGIVLAVPIRSALARRLPSRGEVGTVALTAAGLALFLVAARPSVGVAPAGTGTAAALTGVGVVLAAVAAWWAGRSRAAERAAMWLGVAAGVLFGLVAGMVKLTSAELAGSGAAPASWVAALGHWPLWGVVVAGLSGVALNQRAYRVGRLSASMPVLNIVNVVVALGFGVVVFHEAPSHTPLALLGEVVALGCVATGLRRLGRSDVLVEAARAGGAEEPASGASARDPA